MNNLPENSEIVSAEFGSASEDCFRLPNIETAASAIQAGTSGANSTPSEITTLERRVLAHERILQALICDLASDDPRILDLLRARFGQGWNLGSYDQDFVTTDQYGEHFIRSIEVALRRTT